MTALFVCLPQSFEVNMLIRRISEVSQLQSGPVTCLLSGGLDSTVLLGFLKSCGLEVNVVNVAYGQRHRVELEAAELIAQHYQVPYQLVMLEGFGNAVSQSSQTSDDIEVPEGHYAEESMKVTVVPNRNMFLLSVAAAVAQNWARYNTFNNCAVAYAAHAGDHAIYPDCRPEFAETMANSLWLSDYVLTNLFAPFLDMPKFEIVKLGATFKVPMHMTYSCYKGRDLHCGKCGTCVERREAFQLAGVQDETLYEED